MKKKLSLLFVLLCASMMGFAIDWSGYEYLGDGAGGGAYSNKYKMTLADGQAVVNIQKPGFADEAGIYTTFPAGVSSCTLPSGKYAIQGAGMVLYLSAFTAKETEVTVVHGTGTAVFTVYYEDGTEGGGGGGTPDPDPEPEGINWNDYGWIGNGSGNAAYTDKYKLAPATGQSVVNIQHPGFADEAGIYTTFPAGISSCNLPAGKYAIQGGGIVLYMGAFTAKETEVIVTAGGTNYTFTVYYEDGTEGGSTPEPTRIYDTNFALASQGSSATASSGNASLAIDGNEGSRWESNAADGETWDLDMGQLRIFNTIKILWEGAYCKEFELTYSTDGENWSPLYTETNLTSAGWQLIELNDEVTARYIHYNGTLRATGWGQSFFEFQVLLPGVSVLTSIDLSAAATIAQTGGAGVVLTATPKDQNGQAMAESVSYEITPAAAGHMSGNTYIPDQVGNASIRAYNGDVYSAAVNIIGVPSANLALSTNISTDNKIIAQSDYTPNGTDAFHAVDGNMGSVWQGSPTNGNVDDSREYDCWFVVDLGAFYNIDLVALHFEGACSELYHIDFSENNVDWNLGYNLVGAEGINARNDYWTDLDNNTKVRYVRFWSTKAATGWGMKMFEFEVYGTEWTSGDEEKPVMVSASLVSSTTTSAVIAVEATDNDVVARYHVVDATNGIDANFTPSDGKITINGLTHNTAYNFTITAKDASNNESENSMVVAVSTPFDVTINLALNQPCEGGYYDNNPAESDDKANDGLEDTQWTTYGAHEIELDWWVVDLGQIYNLTNISVLWGDVYSPNYILQARVDAPTAADKADDAAWVTLATVSDAVANAEKSTNVSGVGRYVRFRALARTDFLRLKEFRVYGSGVASVDTEAPVMTSASLVSNTDSRAIIAVAATDDQGVANYHVVDAGHSIDAHLAAEGGNITVSGLAGSTTYTFTITAVDYFGNESANSKSVSVTTTAHYTEPQAACPAPEWPAAQVKALYSPTYSADYNHQDWGGGTVYTQDTYGKKYETNANGYFGADGFALNCLLMEKLHYDIWIADDATIRIVPIWGGAEQGITVSLTGQQWNSVDIDLTAYNQVTNWGNIYQMKVDYAVNLTFWVANAYFYRTTEIVDEEAPTNVSASIAAQGFKSVKLTVSAEDNMGAVNFSVKNGDNEVAVGASASGEPTTITISNLTPGTAYNFSVIAKDGKANEAAPVAVSTKTKALPKSAPVNLSGKLVIPVFTDAMAGAPAQIHSGGWGEATIHEWMDLSASDKVFYVQNLNYAGWHSWGADIDATGMQFFHVDVYSVGATSVNVTPISHDPTQEGSYTIELTPNAWTGVDVPLSAYANIEWNKIFQFKFMNPVGGDELLIDNVYFWKGPDYVRNDSWLAPGELGTVCIPQGAVANGGDIYELVGKDENGKVVFATVDNNAMEPGKPYLFEASSKAMNFFYTDAEPASEPDNSGAMKGTFSDLTLTELENVYYFAGDALWGCADLSSLSVPANRAYVKLDEVGDFSSANPAPGRRYITMGVHGKNTATGIGNVEGEAQNRKVLIEGQLFILRGEKLYDATGRLVK